MAQLGSPNPVTALAVRVTTASVTSVNSGAASATILAANTERVGCVIVNTDANDLYIKYGATATTSGGGSTYKIPSGATWEMPSPVYVGIIDGIWSADGAGLAEITEL